MEEQLIEKVTEEVKKNPSFRALLFINPMASTRDQASRLTTLGIKSIGKKQRRAKERQGEVARERGKGEESRRKGEKGAEYTHSLSFSFFFPFLELSAALSFENPAETKKTFQDFQNGKNVRLFVATEFTARGFDLPDMDTVFILGCFFKTQSYIRIFKIKKE